MTSPMFDFFEDLIIYTDMEDNILEVNEPFIEFLKKDKKDIIGKKESELFTLFFCNKSDNKMKEFLAKGKVVIVDEILELANEKRYYRTKKEFLADENKIKITRRDVTEYEQYLSLYNEDKTILKYIATGKPLEFVLNKIIQSLEMKNSDMYCSIFLLDESKTKLLKGAAPSLPDFYNDKIDGMLIGPNVGSCGASVFLKQRVVVEDISTHENWKQAKKLAEKANLHACWSQPIFSSTNEILGSFAIYYDKVKSPTKFDIHLIENIASITGIAIEKHNNEKKLEKQMQERKKQEELLLHKTKQAMLGEMLENIAHQWRQPLSVISTYATGILMKREHGIDTSDIEQEAFEAINLNAQYLSSTIDDFRKYFMSNSKKEEFEIKDCLIQAKKLIKARVESQKVKIIESNEDIKIFNYENEFTQVFINLFNNSIDALSNIESDKKYIYISTHEELGNVFIKIIDSANGIDESILDRIFEPYFTTKHKTQGTGIGLYMCQEIIEKHMGGSIFAKNGSFDYEGKRYYGLEFTITLPVINTKI